MSTAADVASHYSNGGLQAAIESGLAALGKTLSSASIADLAPVDEFHIGGRGATVDVCEQLDVQPGSAVLDVGCGIGGTARFISSTFGCEVTGIDLTAEYVEVARSISEATHMADQLTFETGNALDMPFVDSASTTSCGSPMGATRFPSLGPAMRR
ncbi:MAG: methyltransferase domain-containing protein [Ilumatobacter sp.]|uniref:SAM-dependent methyltransferase n=1 Tax=Ilumatobacter sp. TaxID=1967498 RepID=UPI003752F8CD|nr:methyltransferase domain-containing protein [Ilumatobacter sp.]